MGIIYIFRVCQKTGGSPNQGRFWLHNLFIDLTCRNWKWRKEPFCAENITVQGQKSGKLAYRRSATWLHTKIGFPGIVFNIIPLDFSRAVTWRMQDRRHWQTLNFRNSMKLAQMNADLEFEESLGDSDAWWENLGSLEWNKEIQGAKILQAIYNHRIYIPPNQIYAPHNKIFNPYRATLASSIMIFAMFSLLGVNLTGNVIDLPYLRRVYCCL